MTSSFRPFRFADLRAIRVQPKHREIVGRLAATPGAAALMEGPFSWTLEREGRAWAAAGIIEPLSLCGATEGKAWAVLADDMQACMVAATRIVRLALEAYPGPVVADIDESYSAAVRWVEALGFARVGHGKWVFSHARVS
jgi:hypothetical protein